jgi:hypothetical protein
MPPTNQPTKPTRCHTRTCAQVATQGTRQHDGQKLAGMACQASLTSMPLLVLLVSMPGKHRAVHTISSSTSPQGGPSLSTTQALAAAGATEQWHQPPNKPVNDQGWVHAHQAGSRIHLEHANLAPRADWLLSRAQHTTNQTPPQPLPNIPWYAQVQA